MEIVQQLSERGSSEESLVEIEAAIGARLPADYRDFMTGTNGGRPDPSVFAYDTKKGRKDSRVRYFLTLDPTEARYTVPVFMDRYAGRYPPLTFPIACDSFGNLILLDVGARSIGAVYFWDHEKEDMNRVSWKNIFIISSSFAEFLISLT